LKNNRPALNVGRRLTVLYSSSKHHTSAQQTLFDQLLHEHQQQQKQQETVVEESDVIGDDVTSKQTRLVTDIREFHAVNNIN